MLTLHGSDMPNCDGQIGFRRLSMMSHDDALMMIFALSTLEELAPPLDELMPMLRKVRIPQILLV